SYLVRSFTTNLPLIYVPVFFFNDTPTTEIYTLSLHDGSSDLELRWAELDVAAVAASDLEQGVCDLTQRAGPHHVHQDTEQVVAGDRKSTRLNSSHDQISYAVFCLKKKKKNT